MQLKNSIAKYETALGEVETKRGVRGEIGDMKTGFESYEKELEEAVSGEEKEKVGVRERRRMEREEDSDEEGEIEE